MFEQKFQLRHVNNNKYFCYYYVLFMITEILSFFSDVGGGGSGYGNTPVVGFEDVQTQIKEIKRNCSTAILISTLPVCTEGPTQNYIEGTLSPEKEEETINKLLEKETDLGDFTVFIYGQNASDNSVWKKAGQLRTLGFENTFVYLGGMFEWCLLNDIYGAVEFQIKSVDLKKLDPLFYKPPRLF